MRKLKTQSLNNILSYLASNIEGTSTGTMYSLIWKIHLLSLNERGYCWMSTNNLIKELNLSKTAVNKGLSKLEEQGYIKREHNESVTSRKIYIQYDNPKFAYNKSGAEESVIEPVIEESVEDIIENVIADLPYTKPPSGPFGPKLRNKTKKTKEQKASERSLNSTFNELVVDIYPADKRGSISKAFTVFKNLKFDDQQEVLRNIKRYVDMIDIPFHKSLINCLNDGEYKDDYLDAREKSNRKRTSKTESSTAHNFNKNKSLDDYYKIN